MTDEDFDDDIHGDDYDGEIDTGVQLGFVSQSTNELFGNPMWDKWDGGKVGGKPSWLDPINLPLKNDLLCECCSSPMVFLLQIYCPLDDVEDAFHRSLYIFICKKKNCVDEGSVRCFRCQLGRKNQIYPYDAQSSKEAGSKIAKLSPKLCAICGCRGPSTCSKCKNISYCSREHQARDWKDHKLCCSIPAASIDTSNSGIPTKIIDSSLSQNQITFPEFDLSISAEILEDLVKVDALNKSVLEATIWENATAVEIDDGLDDEEEKDDADLTQTDYNAALGNEASDPVYTKFMERVRRGGSNQVLRYIRWDDIEGPLNLSSSDIKTNPSGSRDTITNGVGVGGGSCVHCGADRKFEFQIMPQLLHFLRVDRRTKIVEGNNQHSDQMPELKNSETIAEENENSRNSSKEDSAGREKEISSGDCLLQNKSDEDIDYGTIDIYTCTASCSHVANSNKTEWSTYLEEMTYVQKPMSFVRSEVK